MSHLSPLGILGFPGSSDGKESACNAEDLGSIRELGRSPREGNGNPLQYSFPENSMDRGARQATVHGVAKRWTQLSNFHFNHFNTEDRDLAPPPPPKKKKKQFSGNSYFAVKKSSKISTISSKR